MENTIHKTEKNAGKMMLRVDEFVANKGKNVNINVGDDVWARHAIKTRFVNIGENYIDIIREYVAGIYQEGDFISISEKIIALCQNRVVKREDIKIGVWARFLSKFASHKNRGGYGVGLPINMQYAIDKVGLARVILGSVIGGILKLFGIKGGFYQIVGREVSGLDGFYDGSWNEYKDIGIEIPENPSGVCNEIKDKIGINCMIVDANDLGREILGKSDDLKFSDDYLKEIIRDNPACQGVEMTPIILIRKVK